MHDTDVRMIFAKSPAVVSTIVIGSTEFIKGVSLSAFVNILPIS